MKRRSLLPMGGGAFATPFDMLAGCHVRIRMFTDLAARITIEPAPPEQVAEAASRLALYFGTALPLHEEDEEKTLHRTMMQYAIAGSDALFARLRAEHRAIEAILHRLLPRWRIVARTPELLAGESGVLTEGAAALSAAFVPHLEMEENELYPLAQRCLPDDVQARMLRAMRARREPVIDALHSLHANKEIHS